MTDSVWKDVRRHAGSLFRVHDWRNGMVTLGEVPAEFIEEQSEGKLNIPGRRR